MPTRLETNQTILFIGDSITDCSRRDHAQPLGNGYVKMVRDLLIARMSPTKAFSSSTKASVAIR